MIVNTIARIFAVKRVFAHSNIRTKIKSGVRMVYKEIMYIHNKFKYLKNAY